MINDISAGRPFRFLHINVIGEDNNHTHLGIDAQPGALGLGVAAGQDERVFGEWAEREGLSGDGLVSVEGQDEAVGVGAVGGVHREQGQAHTY